jgi:hypothetical protein
MIPSHSFRSGRVGLWDLLGVLLAAYATNWQKHFEHSEIYTGKGGSP